MKLGLILSLITVLIWAVERVSSRFLLVEYHVEPVIFTCFSLFVCSIILILVAGPGKGGLDTLRRPHTWGYGILQVLMNITDMLMLALITSTEASFLARIAIIMAIVLKWIFLATKPHKTDFLGLPLILAGFAVVAVGLPEEVRGMALFWLFFTALFNTMRTMIAETHPSAQAANTIKSRCRVTGYVVMVTSFTLLISLFGFAFARTHVPALEGLPFAAALPTIGHMFHQTTLFAAGLMGLTILPFAMYFYFYTARVAKTEVFMMVTSIQPFLAFALESMLQRMGLLDIREITTTDLIAGVVIVLGAFGMIAGRIYTAKRQLSLQMNPEMVVE